MLLATCLSIFVSRSNIIRSWDDYYYGIEHNTIYSPEKIEQQISLTYDDRIYVHSSYFSVSSKTHGGAICYTNVDKDAILCVELCTFDTCFTSGEGGGGAIYITSGYHAIHKVCSYNCTAVYPYGVYRSQYQFAFLQTRSDAENIVYEVSVCNSYNTNSQSYYAIRICKGYQMVKNLNISKNQCAYNTAFSFGWAKATYYKFLTICDNYATKRSITLFSLGSIALEYTNIIKNRVVPSNFGLIEIKAQATLIHCTVLENTALCMFELLSDYSITFIDCSINPSDFERVSGRGSVITDNWTPESTFVIEYVGYNTAFCIGAVDRTSTPTPMTPTPETPTPNTPTPNTPTPNTPTPNTPTPKTVTPIIKTPNTVTPNTPKTKTPNSPKTKTPTHQKSPTYNTPYTNQADPNNNYNEEESNSSILNEIWKFICIAVGTFAGLIIIIVIIRCIAKRGNRTSNSSSYSSI